MRSLAILSCFVLALPFATNVSLGQEAPSPKSDYVPSLGDIMMTIQLRHSKIWYAGSLKNWPLADYERVKIEETLKQLSKLYPDSPSAEMSKLEKGISLLRDAIKAKSEAQFDQAFSDVTTACNSCHEATGRGFIDLGTPKFSSPYSNQVFAPK